MLHPQSQGSHLLCCGDGSRWGKKIICAGSSLKGQNGPWVKRREGVRVGVSMNLASTSKLDLSLLVRCFICVQPPLLKRSLPSKPRHYRVAEQVWPGWEWGALISIGQSATTCCHSRLGVTTFQTVKTGCSGRVEDWGWYVKTARMVERLTERRVWGCGFGVVGWTRSAKEKISTPEVQICDSHRIFL